MEKRENGTSKYAQDVERPFILETTYQITNTMNGTSEKVCNLITRVTKKNTLTELNY